MWINWSARLIFIVNFIFVSLFRKGFLNPIQMVLFGDAHGWRGAKRSASLKLVTNITYFMTQFLIVLTFFESWKVVLINMVAILMIPAKLVTLGLLKIKVFWNRGYEVIVSIYDVTNKIVSRESNFIVDVVIWLKFGNSSISMREFIKLTSILSEFDQKNLFIREVLFTQVK